MAEALEGLLYSTRRMGEAILNSIGALDAGGEGEPPNGAECEGICDVEAASGEAQPEGEAAPVAEDSAEEEVPVAEVPAEEPAAAPAAQETVAEPFAEPYAVPETQEFVSADAFEQADSLDVSNAFENTASPAERVPYLDAEKMLASEDDE
jgi:hypothetical protein